MWISTVPLASGLSRSSATASKRAQSVPRDESGATRKFRVAKRPFPCIHRRASAMRSSDGVEPDTGRDWVSSYNYDERVESVHVRRRRSEHLSQQWRRRKIGAGKPTL